jgi:hypothetical protein
MDDVRFWKFAVVILAQHGQIDRRSHVLYDNWAVAFAVHAMAWCAIVRKHCLAIVWGDFVGWGSDKRIGLNGVSNSDSKSCGRGANKKASQHRFLTSGPQI